MNIKKKLASKILKFAQNKVTKIYEEDGLTDEVLDTQIRINELRNKYNISETDENDFAQ